jgi:superfamily II DNA/RNA helicase
VALRFEERSALEALLAEARGLPEDTKLTALRERIAALREQGYRQVMVFTQYTATMDALRERLADTAGWRLMCYSGRGGEIRDAGGRWATISRDEARRRFRNYEADVLLCTDAAGEGLNFQFCGALINYDMPWNPMRVEQRIGRIDRLGQAYDRIQVANLLYEHTVEADVHAALVKRIGSFERHLGRMQPILAQIPAAIASAVLSQQAGFDAQATVDKLAAQAEAQPDLDLDELEFDDAVAAGADLNARPEPAVDLGGLDALLRTPAALPPGTDVSSLGPREYSYRSAGMKRAVRVTTSADYYEAHSESTELWSPGSPLFPQGPPAAGGEGPAGVATASFWNLLGQLGSRS